MNSKITVIRALSSVVARRALSLASIIAAVALIILLVAIWALAHFVSGWFWLLLVVYVPVLVIIAITYIFVRFIISKLYSVTLSLSQKAQIDSFVDKIQRILEARGLGWWWFAVLSIKDLLVHRELRTLNSIVADTTSLKRDFDELEASLRR